MAFARRSAINRIWGWLPPGVAVPPPTPRREVELNLVIESDGGYLFIFESRDRTVRGDTWHESIADAREQRQTSFGVSPDAWQVVEGQPAAG